MKNILTMNSCRRIRLLLAGCAAALLCGSLCSANESYSALLLSDTHFDKKIYDEKTTLPPYWRGEALRNYQMWDNGDASLSYRLLEQAAKCKSPDTALLLHCGDLIQGDFDSPESTAKATAEIIRDLTTRFELPLYMAMDNHDSSRYPVYPAGEKDFHPNLEERAAHEQAFLKVMQQYQKENLKFSRMEAPLFLTNLFQGDLYIFTRGTPEGMRYLADELAKYPAETIRHTFVITHLAVILGKNYGEQKPWQTDCFANTDPALRDEIIAELASRNAIVLSGHKHYWEKIDAKFPQGTIHQLMINSNLVHYNWEACEKAADFAASAAAEGKSSTLDDGGALEITDYILYSDRGFAKLLISDDGVIAECYSGDSEAATPLRTIQLK